MRSDKVAGCWQEDMKSSFGKEEENKKPHKPVY